MLHIIIHPQKSKLIILPIKDNSREPNFYGTLILKHTPKGARVGKFRIKQGEKEDFRAPEELIELLRLADKILIAEGNEASEAGFKELLTAYQLDYGYTTTCRLCLLAGKFTTNSPIRFHNESVCEDCAKKELIKEARSIKLGSHGQERLLQILDKTKNLERGLAMLKPEEICSGMNRIENLGALKVERSIKVKDLPLHEEFKKLLLLGMKELMPVQALSVDAG